MDINIGKGKMLAEKDQEKREICLSSSRNRDKGKMDGEEEGIELQSGHQGPLDTLPSLEDVFPNKYTELISARYFKVQVYSVKIGEEHIFTTLTNLGSEVDQWIIENSKASHVGMDVKTWGFGSEYELDMVQICVGQNCLLFHAATSDTQTPQKLKLMLKEMHVAAPRDLLGVCSKILRGKCPCKSSFVEVNFLNLKELAKKIIRDERLWDNQIDLLERVMKNDHKTPLLLSSKRWNMPLKEEQLIFASHEAHRGYQLGSKLLAASKAQHPGGRRVSYK